MLKLKIHFIHICIFKSSKSGEKCGKKTFFSARGQSSYNSRFNENFDNFHFVDFDVELHDELDFDSIESAAHH